MAKIGFIGMGNMGYAILCGLLKLYRPQDILFTDVNKERMEYVKHKTGVNYVDTNAELANQSEILFLAVKPQFFGSVLKNIKYVVKADQIIVSIAPGITIESLKKSLGEDKRIVRAMPNTPALLGEGMTGVTYEKELFTIEEQNRIREMFESFGRMEFVEERLMSAVVCASGSSPAYVYMFIEALADSVVRCGMPRDKAYSFAAQAVKGAAEMVLQTGKHPGELKDQVCSPAGTTIEGVAALEEYGFRNAVLKANEACYKKSEGMK